MHLKTISSYQVLFFYGDRRRGNERGQLQSLLVPENGLIIVSITTTTKMDTCYTCRDPAEPSPEGGDYDLNEAALSALGLSDSVQQRIQHTLSVIMEALSRYSYAIPKAKFVKFHFVFLKSPSLHWPSQRRRTQHLRIATESKFPLKFQPIKTWHFFHTHGPKRSIFRLSTFACFIQLKTSKKMFLVSDLQWIYTGIESFLWPRTLSQPRVKKTKPNADELCSFFRPEELVLAFNGGKDSVVLIYLIHVAYRLRFGSSCPKLITIYFNLPNSFPEVKDFMLLAASLYVY